MTSNLNRTRTVAAILESAMNKEKGQEERLSEHQFSQLVICDVQGRTLGKNSDEQSLTTQVDFGWALWKTQKTATSSQKAENYLLDVCWTREETSKATASNVISQISSLRDDTSQKCCLRLTG